MDVKHESKLMLTLCQGCLSADRKLTCVTGQNKVLYFKLREDLMQNENDSIDLLLCWECIALLNKMKYFQARIKTAQYRLVEFLQSFYDKKDIPHTLSQLLKTKHKQYDYKYQFIYEEENKDILFQQNNLCHEEKDHILEQKDLILEQKDQNIIFEQKDETDDEKLLIEIKIEKNDVKQEFENDNISINNEMDYYEPELKHETGEVIKYRRRNKGPKKSRIQKYEDLATITKINGTFTKNVSPYYETVFVSSREVDQIFQETAKYRYDKKFLCKLCNFGYNKRLDYLRHKTLHHSQPQFPTNCLACKRELLSESNLEEHWKDTHNPMLRCTFCGELSRTKGELKKHLNRSHTKTFTCNSCPLEFKTLAEFSKHYIMTHERVTCDYCNKSLFSKRILETHIKKEHLPHYCSVCNKNFPAYKHFAHHQRRVHPELRPSLSQNENEANVELRYCVECDKQFPTILKYKKHLQQSVRHTPKKKVSVPCPACDKIFTRVLYKNNHYRLVHLKKSKHYCVLCDKYFATGFGVRTHIQYVHQKMQMPRDKICDICGRGFSTNRILINHRRTHTGERPFQCQYCPAAFGQKSAMQTHQKSQHKNIMFSSL